MMLPVFFIAEPIQRREESRADVARVLIQS